MAFEDAWNQRYSGGDTPWDMGHAHPLLVERLDVDPALGLRHPGRAFVPGCGRGWDAAALAWAGWRVTALDAAPAAVEHAAELLEPEGGRALLGDALEYEEPADMVFDHTFFCAIPPGLRPAFGVMARRVVGSGGSVVSIVFPIGRHPPSDGPPHAMDVADLGDVLGPSFSNPETGDEGIFGGRPWPHRWARWHRV